MAKMSLTPSKQTVDEFINAAGKIAPSYPWEDNTVRDDMKNVALRLPESYVLKLQWISEQTGIPQQRLLRDWLLPSIDEKITALTK